MALAESARLLIRVRKPSSPSWTVIWGPGSGTAAELSSESMALPADVSDGEAIRAAIAKVMERFGRIDAVHNNVGIASPSKPLDETTEQEWDEGSNAST